MSKGNLPHGAKCWRHFPALLAWLPGAGGGGVNLIGPLGTQDALLRARKAFMFLLANGPSVIDTGCSVQPSAHKAAEVQLRISH